jgi:hypothetical protein
MKNRRKRTGGNVTVMADISRRSILSIIKQLGEKIPRKGGVASDPRNRKHFFS